MSTYFHTRTFQNAKSRSHYFNLGYSTLRRHFNVDIASRKSLEIQPRFFTRRKSYQTENLYKDESSAILITN